MFVSLEYKINLPSSDSQPQKAESGVSLIFDLSQDNPSPRVECIQGANEAALSGVPLPFDQKPVWLCVSSNQGNTWTGEEWSIACAREYFQYSHEDDFTLEAMCKRYPDIRAQIQDIRNDPTRVQQGGTYKVQRSRPQLWPFTLMQTFFIGFWVALSLYLLAGLIVSSLALSGIGVPPLLFFALTLVPIKYAGLACFITSAIVTPLCVAAAIGTGWMFSKANQKYKKEKSAIDEMMADPEYDCCCFKPIVSCFLKKPQDEWELKPQSSSP